MWRRDSARFEPLTPSGDSAHPSDRTFAPSAGANARYAGTSPPTVHIVGPSQCITPAPLATSSRQAGTASWAADAPRRARKRNARSADTWARSPGSATVHHDASRRSHDGTLGQPSVTRRSAHTTSRAASCSAVPVGTSGMSHETRRRAGRTSSRSLGTNAESRNRSPASSGAG
jgi:hypothetical protein